VIFQRIRSSRQFAPAFRDLHRICSARASFVTTFGFVSTDRSAVLVRMMGTGSGDELENNFLIKTQGRRG
jgi:hypothetical protein